jgi:hypothetical protein
LHGWERREVKLEIDVQGRKPLDQEDFIKLLLFTLISILRK